MSSLAPFPFFPPPASPCLYPPPSRVPSLFIFSRVFPLPIRSAHPVNHNLFRFFVSFLEARLFLPPLRGSPFFFPVASFELSSCAPFFFVSVYAMFVKPIILDPPPYSTLPTPLPPHFWSLFSRPCSDTPSIPVSLVRLVIFPSPLLSFVAAWSFSSWLIL